MRCYNKLINPKNLYKMKFKHTLLFVFSIVAVVTLFDSCRKGPEDPWLTFRSRKARMVGDWIAKDYKINGRDMLIDIDRDTSKQVPPCVPASTINDYYRYTTITHNFEYRFNFLQNGDFNSTFRYFDNYNIVHDIDSSDACKNANYNTDDSTTVNTGTWEFGGGVGAARNKEQLVIIDPFNNFSTTWDIVQLKNKEVKLKRIFLTTTNADQVEELLLVPYK